MFKIKITIRKLVIVFLSFSVAALISIVSGISANIVGPGIPESKNWMIFLVLVLLVSFAVILQLLIDNAVKLIDQGWDSHRDQIINFMSLNVKDNLEKSRLFFDIDLDLKCRTSFSHSQSQEDWKEINFGETGCLKSSQVFEFFESSGRSVLILGKSGSGKSFLIDNLVMELIGLARKDANTPVPVPLNLVNWKNSDKSINDWFARDLNRVYRIVKRRALRWIQEGWVFPVFDGLDEVPLKSLDKCINSINEFIENHKIFPVIVGARSDIYSGSSKKISSRSVIEIQSLGSHQISAALNTAGTSLKTVRAMNRRDRGLGEIVDTPFMLKVLLLSASDLTEEQIVSAENPKEFRDFLFHKFIDSSGIFNERNLASKGFRGNDFVKWILHLAKNLKKFGKDRFFLEEMSPAWLGKKIWIHSLIKMIFFSIIVFYASINFFDFNWESQGGKIDLMLRLASVVFFVVGFGFGLFLEKIFFYFGFYELVPSNDMLLAHKTPKVFIVGVMLGVLSSMSTLFDQWQSIIYLSEDMVSSFVLWFLEGFLICLMLGIILGFYSSKANRELVFIELVDWFKIQLPKISDFLPSLFRGVVGAIVFAMSFFLIFFISVKSNLYIIENFASAYFRNWEKGFSYLDLDKNISIFERFSSEVIDIREPEERLLTILEEFPYVVLIVAFVGAFSGVTGWVADSCISKGKIWTRRYPNEGIFRTMKNSIYLNILKLVVFFILAIFIATLFFIFNLTFLKWNLNLENEIFLGVILIGFFLLVFIFLDLIFSIRFVFQYFYLRVIYFVAGCGPLRFVEFLDLATSKKFLNKEGGGYEFFHKSFLEWLTKKSRDDIKKSITSKSLSD